MKDLENIYNKERIDKILDLIEDIWRKHPEWTLGQLLDNSLLHYGVVDVFYVKDEVMEEALKRELEILSDYKKEEPKEEQVIDEEND